MDRKIKLGVRWLLLYMSFFSFGLIAQNLKDPITGSQLFLYLIVTILPVYNIIDLIYENKNK